MVNTSSTLLWHGETRALAICMGGDPNMYAVLENKVEACIYKNFKERGGGAMKGS